MLCTFPVTKVVNILSSYFEWLGVQVATAQLGGWGRRRDGEKDLTNRYHRYITRNNEAKECTSYSTVSLLEAIMYAHSRHNPLHSSKTTKTT